MLLVGARGAGKSTSASRFADTAIDLSMPGPKLVARQDPAGLLAGSPGTVVIDEWQEAPQIVGAMKRIVDTDPSRIPGRFIFTARYGRLTRLPPDPAPVA